MTEAKTTLNDLIGNDAVEMVSAIVRDMDEEGSQIPVIKLMAELSIAASLKRIADALDDLGEVVARK